jgi:hypothetical protein
LDGYQRLPLDTLKLLFSSIDISITVKQVEAWYADSGKGRPHYPARSMLLALMFMRFEAVPSVRKLCRKLEKRPYAREICEFQGDKAPKHNTFSLFISRARPETIEGLFVELRDQAFIINIVDKEAAVKVSLDSTFMKANSRRGRRGGKGDRGARVGKTDRRNYDIGWRAHAATSMSRRTKDVTDTTKRKMYSYRANMEDIETMKQLGYKIGEFTRKAIKEKLEKENQKILNENFEHLANEDKAIALGKIIILQEREIEKARNDPEYKKAQETLDTIEEYTAYVIRVFSTTDYDEIKSELSQGIDSRPIHLGQKFNPVCQCMGVFEMTGKALAFKWFELKKEEQFARDLKRAYDNKFAKISDKIGDEKKQISDLANNKEEIANNVKT